MSLEDDKHLDPTMQFDPELAKRVAEDARKLTANRLSEAEFHEKYHQAYLDEFGVDNRLVSPGENGVPPLESTLTKRVSRRTLLKFGGVTIASLLGTWWLGGRALGAGSVNGNSSESLPPGLHDPWSGGQPGKVQMGMVIDLEACDGCLACSYACSHHNSNPPGVLWIYCMPYMDENRSVPNYFLRLCQHCGSPPCVKVCPVRARHKREIDGLVLTDYDLCIGCRYCMVTCPYGVNYFQWDEPPEKTHGLDRLTDYRGRWVIGNPPKGVMGKCAFCPERQDDGRGNLVCELACPQGVLHFGDMNDPNSRPNRYLARRMKEKRGQISTYRLLEDHGTKPSIIYIGQQPSRAATATDGQVSYADWGMVEKRLPYLNGYKPWFMRLFGGGQ